MDSNPSSATNSPDQTVNPGAPETPQATATPEPKFAEFKQYIPKDYAEMGMWKDLDEKPVSEVLKSFAEAKSFIGRSIQLPTSPEDKEGWQKVYQKLGAPADPRGYDWQPPELPGAEWDKDALDAWKKTAHELGLTKDQYSKLMAKYTADVMNQTHATTQEEAQALKQAEAAIQSKYGQNVKYASNLAYRAVEEYFGSELAQKVMQAAQAEPKLFDGLYRLGQELQEAGIFGQVTPEMFGGMTKEAAAAKINEINANQDHPYWNPKHPEHNLWKNEMVKLMKIRG